MRGFSIIEMLIAMALLVSALASVVLLSSGNRSLAIDSQTQSEGLTVAEKFLESEQAAARKDFRLVNPTTTTETIGNLTYTKKLDVLPLGDFFTKQIKATITWPGTYGRTQNTTLSSLVTNFENVIGGDTCYSTLSDSAGAHTDWAHPVTTNVLLGGISGINDASGAYPISDLQVYKQKMYIAVQGSAQSAGPNSPASASSKTGVGTVSWSGPSGALASGGSVAGASLGNSATSNYLWVSGFGAGLSIPQGATILGIQVSVVRSASNASAIADNQVRLIKSDGATLSSGNRATGTTWSASTVTATYGGVSDLWGEGWSAADIKNANFGVAISVKNSSTQTRTANVDYISVTVTYIRQLYVLNTSTPTSPTLANTLGSNTTAAGFTSVASDGTYVYAAVNSATTPLQVIDTSVSPAVVKTSYSLTGNTAVANTLFYKDGYIYLGLANNPGGPEFNIIDVHNPLSIPAPVGTYELGAGIKSIFVRGNYAYLGTDDNTREVVILNLTDLLHPALGGTYNAPGTTGFGYGQRLYTVGDTLYAGRTYDGASTANEFLILDASNPLATLPAPLGSNNIGPNNSSPFSIYGLVVRDYLAFLLTSSQSNGGKLLAYNISDPTTVAAAPAVFSITLPNAGAGVAMDCEGNYLYAASVPTTGTFANEGSVSIITAP